MCNSIHSFHIELAQFKTYKLQVPTVILYGDVQSENIKSKTNNRHSKAPIPGSPHAERNFHELLEGLYQVM